MSACGTVRIKQTSLNKCLKWIVCSCVFLIASVNGAPGAHGPNGEHLDTEVKHSVSVNPKFETFTETFEVVGELDHTTLRLYVHDYRTNVPIKLAAIETESKETSASAKYDEVSGHYLVSSSSFIESISHPGEHEIVLTILTEDAADLMAATLTITAQEQAEHEDEHHHHFPWWAVGLGVLTFLAGFGVGNKRQKGALA